MTYTELHITSNFSFLRGASHPQELINQAAALGYKAIAITDWNTLAGTVRAHEAAKKKEIKLIVGCRLDIIDGPPLLAYPTNLASYSSLTNLLTLGNRRTEKGKCELYKSDLYDLCKEMKLIVIPPVELDENFNIDTKFKENFKDNLYLAATRYYLGDDAKRLFRLSELSNSLNIPLVATNDVHYHTIQRRQLQDIITCTREKCTIHNAGYKLHPNAERHLKSPDEMLRLFRQYPDAIRRTQEIADACTFSLTELKYRYPKEIITPGRTAMEDLTILTWEGAKEHYGDAIPEKIKNNIVHELTFMEEMNFAEYFLTVYDIVKFARSRNILCQGRGSAANSTVCFCLGITSVDPTKFDLLFERFISSARNEPPDIDVDFEHERREEVMQYIFNKYGRDRAAIVATVTQCHFKGAIKDVGRAMGISVDTIERIGAAVWDFNDEWFEGNRIAEQGLNINDKHLRKTLQLTKEYIGFPRQLGQHTGGFVITDGKLTDLCPVFNARMKERTNIEWNKDDIDTVGFLKIDVLSLGILTCIRKAFDLAKLHYNRHLTLASIPQDDPIVYDRISVADTIGLFQIESRAQQSMLPRLRPRCFYDIVIEVAIVRPGPIQGNMVHPYLRRRSGAEPVHYPSEEIKEILERTLGVPLFQEQAMKIAIIAAGFTPAEADELRRSMATFKVQQGMVSKFSEKLINGMVKRGYTKTFATQVFRQLEGFGSYGFPESHAASFASIVYVSAWLKCYYPDIYACAILNSLPMGFYSPADLVIDARNHKVEVREVDINYSTWDHLLEEKCGQYHALRLGFRQITGMRKQDIDLLIEHRGSGYTSMDQLRDTGISNAALKKLADADAFRSLGMDRRQALWEVSTRDQNLSLFKGKKQRSDFVALPSMSLPEHVVQDYAATSLSIKAHPMSFLREKMDQVNVVTAEKLKPAPADQPIKVAGMVRVRQRPGTAKGVVFMTIQDETGYVNLVIFPDLFEQFRKPILQSKFILVEGTLQKEGEVIYVILTKCYNITRLTKGLTPRNDENLHVKTFNPDETSIPAAVEKTARTVFPGSRDFR